MSLDRERLLDSMREAVRRYEDATRRFNLWMREAQRKFPHSEIEAMHEARSNPHLKLAQGDQQFYGAQATMYGIAYLAESYAEQE